MNFTNVNYVRELDLDSVPAGTKQKIWIQLATDGIGWPIAVPVIVAKGRKPGPVVGFTAAVHGNELNGVPVLQKVFNELNLEELRGTLVGVLVVNVPGLLLGQRKFNDGIDPNHIMPGKPNGKESEIYVYRLMERIVKQFEYLIDLHTASFGRINSYYIRADMDDPVTAKMALLQNADLIVHNPPMDGTLRGAADDLGIPAITLEVGDPNKFQKGMIRSSLTGIHNFLIHFGLTPGEIEEPEEPAVLCDSSYWIYTQGGGILVVHAGLLDKLEPGQTIGSLATVFGERIKEYQAPERGIVIGKSINPVAQSGSRILHLGIMRES